MPENNVYALRSDCPIPPNQVLDLAKEAGLRTAIVIDWLDEPDEEGKQFYFAASDGDLEMIIYALQHANLRALEASR